MTPAENLLDKEKKSADFLLTQVQRANTLIQNAHTAGLRPESRREGVSQQLDAIEQGVARIRKGRWEMVAIPFNAFGSEFRAVG